MEAAAEAARKCRQSGRRVSLVTGLFDPLLAAHARRLAEIARDGGALFVAVGEAPDALLEARARAELVAALAVVDYVILDGQPPQELARLIEADSVFHEEAADRQRTQELTRHVHHRQRPTQ